MKRITFVLMALMLVLLSKSMDAQSIRVMPVSATNISDKAAEMLYFRLNQAVSLNGLASTDNSNKFLLIPSVTVVSIEPTSTAPIQYLAEIEISLFLVDNGRKVIVSQEILTKKGVAENETKAVNEAVNSLKGRDPKLKKLIVNGKNEILEYYNTECENIVKAINAYVECGKYEEALNELNAVPQIDGVSCYDNTLNILSKISREQQDSAAESIKNSTPDVSWVK